MTARKLLVHGRPGSPHREEQELLLAGAESDLAAAEVSVHLLDELDEFSVELREGPAAVARWELPTPVPEVLAAVGQREAAAGGGAQRPTA